MIESSAKFINKVKEGHIRLQNSRIDIFSFNLDICSLGDTLWIFQKQVKVDKYDSWIMRSTLLKIYFNLFLGPKGETGIQGPQGPSGVQGRAGGPGPKVIDFKPVHVLERRFYSCSGVRIVVIISYIVC